MKNWMADTYVTRGSMKDARIWFEGREVLQGTYNGKAAVYISFGYNNYELEGNPLNVHTQSGRLTGEFIGKYLVDIKDAKGTVLIAK